MSETDQGQWDKTKLQDCRRGSQTLLETAYRKLNSLQAALTAAERERDEARQQTVRHDHAANLQGEEAYLEIEQLQADYKTRLADSQSSYLADLERLRAQLPAAPMQAVVACTLVNYRTSDGITPDENGDILVHCVGEQGHAGRCVLALESVLPGRSSQPAESTDWQTLSWELGDYSNNEPLR